jgi:chemotaxis protein MotB
VSVWVSYTDVAMNVLVVLVLYLFTQSVLGSVTGADLLRVKEEQRVLQELVREMLPPELREDVTPIEDGQLLRYRFADRVLFASGSAQLRQSGQEIMDVMARAFQARIGTFSRIQVEGHTDNLNINTAAFPSNWELSSARATSVVRFLQDRGGLSPELLSATGYSQYQPVDADDASERGRERNRRIEIVIVYTLLEPNAR